MVYPKQFHEERRVKKKLAVNLLKYALAVGLLTYVVWSNWGEDDQVGSLSHVWHHHLLGGEQSPDALMFFGALVIGGMAIFITLIRWWVLVRAQDIPLTLSDGIRLGSVGIFFNTFLPGSVGG